MAFACGSTRIGCLLRSTLGSPRSMATTNKIYVGGNSDLFNFFPINAMCVSVYILCSNFFFFLVFQAFQCGSRSQFLARRSLGSARSLKVSHRCFSFRVFVSVCQLKSFVCVCVCVFIQFSPSYPLKWYFFKLISMCLCICIAAIIVRHVDTGDSKGFGFVSFHDNDSVDAAIEGMNGQVITLFYT